MGGKAKYLIRRRKGPPRFLCARKWVAPWHVVSLRVSSSHCAIRTILRQLGLFQSLFPVVFAWLPGLSQELVDRIAISPSSSLPDRSTRGFRRSAPSTSVSWPWIVPRLVPSGCSPISTDASSSHPAWSNTTSRALTRRSPRSAARWNPTALEICSWPSSGPASTICQLNGRFHHSAVIPGSSTH